MRMKDYLIYKPLGGGGEGFVYKARKKDSDEKFAIKLISPSKQGVHSLHKKLIRDAQVVEAIGAHRNLVELIEYGFVNDNSYVVFRFVDGERLDEFIARKKHLSAKRALHIVIQIIEAEKHICSKGYLYRDLKPENILLEKNGNLKLCDFGLCITTQEALVHGLAPDELEGSPLYIPPERIIGRSEGQFSEIYSLGMILYHMLKGETYFTETEINELLAKHIEMTEDKNLSTKLINHSPCLVSLLEKMTARDPARRYQDFASLEKNLTEIVAELPQKPILVLKANV